MKTLAVRLDDDTMDLLGVVSQLEGTSLVDQIRTAIQVHLERKVAEGDFGITGTVPDRCHRSGGQRQEGRHRRTRRQGVGRPGVAPKGSTRGRSPAKAPEGQAELIGQAPPAKPSRGRQR